MPKKPFTHLERDPAHTCVRCNRPLKKNVLARQPNASKCYDCSLKAKGSSVAKQKAKRTIRRLTRAGA